MKKQQIISKEEKDRKLNFLINLGYTCEESQSMHRKISSCNSYLYWMYKYELSEEEAKIKVSNFQKLKSPRCLEYWTHRGFEIEEAKLKVSKHQDKVSFKEGQDIEEYSKKCENRRINKEKYIKLYGEEIGLKKWLDKKEKSKVTLENMIRVYGIEIGEIKWNNYIENQKISQSENKLIEKHGTEKANQIISHRKNLNKFCVDKYKMTGDNKYLNNSYSKSSQKLFWSIYEKLPQKLKDKCYFKELNNEFVLILNSGLCYLFDFVISNIDFCIEFNGDIWHANPKKYSSEDLIFERKASEIWKKDKEKIEALKEMRGIDTIVVWESDWIKNKLEVEKNLIDYINNRFENLSTE
jgi:hypothetical protein